MLLAAIRDATRALKGSPQFVLAYAAVLSLACGGTGALASLLRGLVFRPLPIAGSERLLLVSPVSKTGAPGSLAAAALDSLASRVADVGDLCGFARGVVAIEVGGRHTKRPMEAVTGAYFSMLGGRPHLGSLLDAAHAPLVGQSARVAVLSYGFWRRDLGADPNVVGRQLRVEGIPVTIVGVMAQDSVGLTVDSPPDLVMPLGLVPTLFGGAQARALNAVVRIGAGRRLDQAAQRIDAVWPSVWDSTEAKPAAQRPQLVVQPLTHGMSDLRTRYAASVSQLVALAALLALLAVASVVGLCLTRAVRRSQEYATRRALGAGEGALALQIGTEWLLLALGTAGVSCGLARWGASALVRVLWTSSMPMRVVLGPEAADYAGIVGANLLVGLMLAGVAVAASRQGTLAASRSSVALRRIQHVVLLPQVMLAVVLLVASISFGIQLMGIRRMPLGFHTEGLYWTRLDPVPRSNVGDARSYFRELFQQLGGRGTAAASVAFPTAELRHMASAPTVANADHSMQGEAMIERVSPGFFEVTGTALVAGRDVTWLDDAGSLPVVVVNEALATRLYPDGGAVGRVLLIGDGAAARPATIVGVVENASLGDPRIAGKPIAYRPLLQESPGLLKSPVILLRPSRGAGAPGEGASRMINATGRHFSGPFRSVDDQLARSLARERVLSALSLAFAGLGMIVAAVGLYSTVSHTLGQRRREMAIRVAIGASTRRVLAVSAGVPLLAVAAGSALGVLLSLPVSRAVSPLIVGVEHDPRLATALAISIVCLVGGTSAVWPAFGVARSDVTSVLRE